MNKLNVSPEYVYTTIPASYIGIYHRILRLMTDYGVEMIKDCKANCTDRNSNIIDCFNMFNAAVAAHKLRNNKLADLIITYIEHKLNHLYGKQEKDDVFTWQMDERGELFAVVTGVKNPRFEINEEDGALYSYLYKNAVLKPYAKRLDRNTEFAGDMNTLPDYPSYSVHISYEYNKKPNNKYRIFVRINFLGRDSENHGTIIPLTDISIEHRINDNVVDIDDYEFDSGEEINLTTTVKYKNYVYVQNEILTIPNE